ncbi:MAG: cobalamin-dependent protein, partial [Candidatus Bathyarchaeia archaeon]
MVDVLLISPSFKGMLREPMGLYYLAGVLNSNGVSASLMDLKMELPTRLGFRESIKKLKPRIVGTTSYTFNFSIVQNIVEEIKRAESNITTVMEEIHSSTLPEDVLRKTPSLDLILLVRARLL